MVSSMICSAGVAGYKGGEGVGGGDCWDDEEGVAGPITFSSILCCI